MAIKKMLTRFLAVVLVLALLPSTAFAASYPDTEGHWGVVSIHKADSLSWVSGYTDGTFRPDNQVSRAEFVAFMNRAFGIQPLKDTTAPFSDVGTDEWYSKTVAASKAIGALNIYGNTFNPNVSITREEVASLLSATIAFKEAPVVSDAKPENTASSDTADTKTEDKDIENEIVAKSEDTNAESTDAEKETVDVVVKDEKAEEPQAPAVTRKDIPFKDAAEVADAHIKAVVDLSKRGLIAGYQDGNFGPRRPITRTEALVLLLRATNTKVEGAAINNLKLEDRDGKTYLVDKKNGVAALRLQAKDGRFIVDGKTYLLDGNNAVRLGWMEANGKKMYADKVDGLIRGWKIIDGATYYFQPYDNAMQAGGARSTGDGAYYFDKTGKLVTGTFPSGVRGKGVRWFPPSAKELQNNWAKTANARQTKGQAIVNWAAQFNGRPFKWYGTDLKDPSGVYCCGAVYSAYKEFGIHIPGPADCDMYAEGGYRMVRAQYVNAPKFGGKYVATNWSQLWPGDITYSRASKNPNGYNHAQLFLGMNGGRPMTAHATLADGFVIEPTYIVTNGWGYVYLNSIRYV